MAKYDQGGGCPCGLKKECDCSFSQSDKEIKVVFEPGAFDNFTGDQTELDELIAEIHRMVATGEIFDKSTAVDMEELMEEEPELYQKIVAFNEGRNVKKTLN